MGWTRKREIELRAVDELGRQRRTAVLEGGRAMAPSGLLEPTFPTTGYCPLYPPVPWDPSIPSLDPRPPLIERRNSRVTRRVQCAGIAIVCTKVTCSRSRPHWYRLQCRAKEVETGQSDLAQLRGARVEGRVGHGSEGAGEEEV